MAEKYDAFFGDRGFSPPSRPDYAEHAMLRYTIRVDDKAARLAEAERQHIPLGDWFVSPLHPVAEDLSKWGYRSGLCPEAEKACQTCVNLLPDQEITHQNLELLFSL